ncbi:MAG: hypothetical protein JWL79_1904 [Frankiales bacterium]|jgi:uncharacterized RDD family membrane protein YckC|nr:hypothetical protein [Frankiales bacterium]
MTTPPPPPPPGYGPPPSYSGPPLAEWGSRVGATLIDSLIVAGIIIASFIVGAVLGNLSSALGGLVVVLGYLGGIAFLFWQLYVQGETGQTIGKKQLGIKVLKEADGQVLGPGLSIGRYFVHILDGIPCYLGYLWPLWDAKKQTFADKILQTVVVRA